MDNPCPACEPFKALMEEHLRGAADADQQAASLGDTLGENQAQRDAVRQRIDALERQLGSREGTGASAYDPETGLMTESTTQADGSVLITVKDKNGNEIERRTRDPRDTAQLRAKIAKAREELASLEQAAAEIQKAIDRQQQLASLPTMHCKHSRTA